MVLRELVAVLGLNVKEQEFARGELAAAGVKFALEKAVEAGKKLVEGFIEMAKGAIDTSEQIEKTSQSVGLTTDSLQELIHVGALAGVGLEEMSTSLGILSRNMLHASKGGEEQAKVFSHLGIKIKDAHGKLRATDDVMADVAEKFAKMPDGAEKTATAMELFGRAGKQMIPVLNLGRDGLADMRQEARDLGLVLDEETIKQGKAIHDNVMRLSGLWTGIKNKAGASLFPVLKQVTDGILGWVKANKELIKLGLEKVLGAIVWIGRRVFDVFDVLTGTFKLLYDIVKPIVQELFREFIQILKDIGPVATAAAVAFGIAWALAASPLLALSVALGGIMLLLNSIQRWREGKDSLFGDWMKQLDEWRKPNGTDPWWLKAIKDLVFYMEKALGIAKKLGVSPDDTNGNGPTPGKVKSASPVDPNTGAPVTVGGEGPDFWRNYRRSRSHGEGFFPSLFASDSDSPNAPTPSLPPGQGVLKAPVQQINQRTYQIYQAPGMSPQDVYSVIQDHEDKANEEAAAALGD